jgi:hypothetical protein
MGYIGHGRTPQEIRLRAKLYDQQLSLRWREPLDTRFSYQNILFHAHIPNIRNFNAEFQRKYIANFDRVKWRLAVAVPAWTEETTAIVTPPTDMMPKGMQILRIASVGDDLTRYVVNLAAGDTGL